MGKISTILIIILLIQILLSYHRNKWLSENCEIIGKISSSTGTTLTFNGNGTSIGPVFIPGKTGYLCNDNKTYWE